MPLLRTAQATAKLQRAPRLWATLCLLVLTGVALPAADQLKVHGIFKSNMVLQRNKPIVIWGWASMGAQVTVSFGDLTANATAAGEKGRWEVSFPAQPENAIGRTLRIHAGTESAEMVNVLVGDVWVMNGQSNMAFALKGVYQGEFEASMAHLPLLRHIRIRSGAESEYQESDIREKFIHEENDPDKNWKVVTPEVALQMGAIGFIFGSRIQRSLQIPIGIIDNGRGGASLESLVPRRKFADHPDAAAYLKWVDARRASFDEAAFLKAEMDKWTAAHAKWEKQVADDKAKGVSVARKEPAKPSGEIRTWSVPGRSPSDAASCYNGMFGVFKGLNIKGVAFHQGFNNSMLNTSCNPKFYRVLLKLMIEGWREDFNDPHLPVAVIGGCGGGAAQTRANFEVEGLSPASYIHESQRLGLADINDPEHTAFIPSYDQRTPQLHPQKKSELGIRAACWALTQIYKKDVVEWDTAKLVSAEANGNAMLLTFDKVVRPDDFGTEIEGFSIADQSGVFYLARAEAVPTKDKSLEHRQILVSSLLVKNPVAVRYAWARSPLGNLKINGIPWLPLTSFRTDNFDFTAEVSHLDPDGPAKNAAAIKAMKLQAETALKTRLQAESTAAPVAP